MSELEAYCTTVSTVFLSIETDFMAQNTQIIHDNI